MNEIFFSIISVCYKDSWALSKTARSVFIQKFKGFEYIIIDGVSKDGTKDLASFWKSAGLVSEYLEEPDQGVYDAMNKGVRRAKGRFVCFLNAGDVFAHAEVLGDVARILRRLASDGCLGWGELNGRVWASWLEEEAFKMSSLGFCHQALFVKRKLLLKYPFDDRLHKTDSDTIQLGELYASGASIPIVPKVWAIRGGEPGISANIERTKLSIRQTLLSAYPDLDADAAETIIAFRREASKAEVILQFLIEKSMRLRRHLAAMVLDTLFQPVSQKLDEVVIDRLWNLSVAAFQEGADALTAASPLERLLHAQALRAEIMEKMQDEKKMLSQEIATFSVQEDCRFAKLPPEKRPPSVIASSGYVAALTSFPARIPTLHFVIRSLVEQTCPPDKILLCLGRDEIPNKNWLPRKLREYEERRLKIIFLDKTCHQYDKYLHIAELNRDYPLVIVDDDVIYPPYAMSVLLDAHLEYPEDIIGNRCHLMEVNADGTIFPYNMWKRERRLEFPSFHLIPTGAGGVLYPKGFMLDDAVTDVELILGHAPYADDIWLKFCAVAQGRRTFATRLSHQDDWYHRYTPTMYAGTLMATNVELGLNDVQVQRCVGWLDKHRPSWRKEFANDVYKSTKEGS